MKALTNAQPEGNIHLIAINKPQINFQISLSACLLGAQNDLVDPQKILAIHGGHSIKIPFIH